jgi:hypothetical protein
MICYRPIKKTIGGIGKMAESDIPFKYYIPLSQVATDLKVLIRLGGLGRVETFPNT